MSPTREHLCIARPGVPLDSIWTPNALHEEFNNKSSVRVIDGDDDVCEEERVVQEGLTD